MAYFQTGVVFCFQIAMLVLFLIFGKYDASYRADVYPMFQDIHAMIFVGFGFLMTFLKRYSFSAVGFNFLLGALMLQWAIICQGLFNISEKAKIAINIESLFAADVATAAVLISMGAVLGTTTYLQLLLMGIIEVVFYSLNLYIGLNILKVSDQGGSVFVHTFGAYFGLAVSHTLGRRKNFNSPMEGSRYTSDIFAMIGTVFLWIYWPSFNAIALPPEQQNMAIVNTYLSLASCCVTTFVLSSWLTSEHKFDMVHIQNSTLAGGVAVGTSANLLIQPCGAVLTGMIAGILSVFGYVKLTPRLYDKWRIHDTCGVNNLHGMPGILGGSIGAFMASLAVQEDYHENLYDIFPARFTNILTTNTNTTTLGFTSEGRNASEQAGFQLLSILVTVVIAVVSGSITGTLLKFSIFVLEHHQLYDDEPFWILSEEVPIIQTNINVKPKSTPQLMMFQPNLEY